MDSPAAKLKIVADGFLLRTWYLAPGRYYFQLQDDGEIEGEIRVFNQDDFRVYMGQLGLFKPVEDAATDEKEAKAQIKNSWHAHLRRIWEERTIDKVGEIAGYKRGLIEQQNEKILILKGVKLIKPVKGEFPFIRTFMEQMLGTENLECERVYFWCQRGVEVLYDPDLTRKPRNSQNVMLIGPSSCGKSLLQHGILTRIFGREASIFENMSGGRPRFNKNAIQSEHNFVEDPHISKDFDVGLWAEALKRAAANLVQEAEPKFVDSYTATPRMQCLSISFNNELHLATSLIPRLGRDLLDKLLIFDCQLTGILLGKTRDDIDKILESEIPAFIYWLLHEYTPPEALMTTENSGERRVIDRFGQPNFVSKKYESEAAKARGIDSLRDYLFRLAEGHRAPDETKGVWRERASIMYADLTRVGDTVEGLYAHVIKSICPRPDVFYTFFRMLSAEMPANFQTDPKEDGTWYRISA
jgi:hypothetical protein